MHRGRGPDGTTGLALRCRCGLLGHLGLSDARGSRRRCPDGAVVAPGFRLDLEHFRSLFETVKDFGWNALGLTDPEGPYVYIEGVFDGRAVFVQVLASPPED